MSAACQEAGISRVTGYKWLQRYCAEGEAGLVSQSRRPLKSPSRTDSCLEAQVLELKSRFPAWGARKLAVLLGESSPSPRTIDRILERSGWVEPKSRAFSVGRFAKASCNEMWQMDFKGVPLGKPQLLGCIDDASRFCLFLKPTATQKLEELWEVLWEAFGIYGLPEAILTDNGLAFRNMAMKRWSSFDIRLLRLGIRPVHGRPSHPQTQGKVERFFGTLERENAWSGIDEFRQRYNTLRPHEALEMKTPAQCYMASARPRPKEMPPLDPPEGSIHRRTDDHGVFQMDRIRYKLGKAARCQTVGILGESVYLGTANLGHLEAYKV